MLIDTHCHLNFNAYKEDFDEVIKRTLKDDVLVINVGTNYQTSEKAIEVAQRYPQGVYAAVGLHPIHLETGLVKIKNDTEEIEAKIGEEDFDYEKYKKLAKNPKVKAVGEIGLDYYWRPKTTKKKELFKQKQKDLLLKQLELAKELNLPVIFHCRMAHQDLIEVLKFQISKYKLQTNSKFQIQNSKLRGVIHCFTGTWEQAEEYLEMGFYLGFNGLIFKMNFDEIIKKILLDRILLETDCPYLTPSRENSRNEPLYVKYIAQKIAEVKSVSFEKIAEITTQNARKLFNI